MVYRARVLITRKLRVFPPVGKLGHFRRGYVGLFYNRSCSYCIVPIRTFTEITHFIRSL